MWILIFFNCAHEMLMKIITDNINVSFCFPDRNQEIHYDYDINYDIIYIFLILFCLEKIICK